MQLNRQSSTAADQLSDAHWRSDTAHGSLQAPLARISDTADAGLQRTLADHFWYPAAQRCGCGLNLRNSQHWTAHVTDVAAEHASTPR